jgi:hypothetical protein
MSPEEKAKVDINRKLVEHEQYRKITQGMAIIAATET